jgi:hypothetical protein
MSSNGSPVQRREMTSLLLVVNISVHLKKIRYNIYVAMRSAAKCSGVRASEFAQLIACAAQPPGVGISTPSHQGGGGQLQSLLGREPSGWSLRAWSFALTTFLLRSRLSTVLQGHINQLRFAQRSAFDTPAYLAQIAVFGSLSNQFAVVANLLKQLWAAR